MSLKIRSVVTSIAASSASSIESAAAVIRIVACIDRNLLETGAKVAFQTHEIFNAQVKPLSLH
jgi:hypothetical protein